MTTTIQSAKDLVAMSRDELDSLYKASEAGPIPQGDSIGTALVCPGSGLNCMLAKIAKPIWQGKVFDPATSTLINKILGLRLFTAKVYKAESWLDGKPSVIIDYSETSTAVGGVRDEIRQVAPGIYLGIAYLRTKGRARAVNFALDLTAGRKA
ncbi:MAG: hypothetical protein HY077_04065 [Elusimicrobia bacterium]|nr:hypothetical protein [Elusimicrobiota bacterium]